MSWLSRPRKQSNQIIDDISYARRVSGISPSPRFEAYSKGLKASLTGHALSSELFSYSHLVGFCQRYRCTGVDPSIFPLYK
jgi:hypothetical protein